MKVSKKFFPGVLLTAFAFSAGFLMNNQPNAQAKSAVKVVWRQKMTRSFYTINQSKAKNGYAYSAKLGKKSF